MIREIEDMLLKIRMYDEASRLRDERNPAARVPMMQHERTEDVDAGFARKDLFERTCRLDDERRLRRAERAADRHLVIGDRVRH